MTSNTPEMLTRLKDSEMTLADSGQDVRGRTVIDRAGEEIGEVSGLMLDAAESKVRFLEVASGGFLGIGERTFLIPVDAVSRVDGDHVHVDQSREGVVGAPGYDPNLMYDQSYYGGVYGHYGLTPYWGAGYIYPGNLYY